MSESTRKSVTVNDTSGDHTVEQLNVRTIAQRLRRERERAIRLEKGKEKENQPSEAGDNLTHNNNDSRLPPNQNRIMGQRLRRENERLTRQQKGKEVMNHPQQLSEGRVDREIEYLRMRNRAPLRIGERRADVTLHPTTPVNAFVTDEVVHSTLSRTRSSKRPREYCESSEHNFPPIEDQSEDGSSEDELNTNTQILRNHITTVSIERHFLGPMNIVCPHCKALHWIDERLLSSSIKTPFFGTCCLQGKICLPDLREPPPALKALYDGDDYLSTSFRSNIRRYNAANAFTSLGCSLEPRILNGRGPKSFTIHGELRHRTGSLLPDPGMDGSYAQLYIYDPSSALRIRSGRNEDLDVTVFQIIQDTMLAHNVFYPKFCQAYSILDVLNSDDQNLPIRLHYSAATDRRRYNLPDADEIAVILPGDGSEITTSRDIILHLKGNIQLMRISECHPAYLPLHYVLFFPFGELGWEPELKQWDVRLSRRSTTRLTQMQYFSYRLFQRPDEYSTILRGGKLFQEFLVDAWATTEQNRLRYIRHHQSNLRSELYKGLTDIADDGLQPDQVGQRFILPSSFMGGSRHLFEIYQDSMAITRYHHHPDIFLTMTANPKWPEITSALLPNQTVLDRPDLVARVFELKRKKLMDVIKIAEVFGKVVAHVFTIEFQKRGLPHMHALIFLQESDKIHEVDQVDRVISAEFPDENEDPLLFQTVKNCMLHGPCGKERLDAPCMSKGKCTKGYPRTFVAQTTLGEDGYPIYRRRNDGRVFTVRGHPFDNRDVVPYNPYLSKLFDCHINVEVCAGVRCVKYIHKYIFKGDDRSTVIVGARDEIQQYLDSRYIAPPEAAWRLFGHVLHEEKPAVVRLVVHLPGMHHVIFDPDEQPGVIQRRAAEQKSSLMSFFTCCENDPSARAYTYQEFPEHFVWDKQNKVWHKRRRGFAIGRMYFVSPNAGERFYLRLLLTVVKGPSSFESLRTVNGELYDTFKSACVARGLLEDDGEWIRCLQEAVVMNTGYQLRRLFCVILLECHPLNPHDLWDKFAINICDDLAHKLRTTHGITNPTETQILDYGLYLLNELLLESGKTLQDNFPTMPQPQQMWTEILGNRLIYDHMQLRMSINESDVTSNVERLNSDQRSAYETIIKSVNDNEGRTFFLNGGAGTGKTFLYNTIAASCRITGNIVITVASSGIASLLLVGGRTTHSTFRIPLDVHEDSICNVGKQTAHAELFRETKLIIWDEVPMQHRFCVEAVNRTLQDVRDSTRPFGGITVVLGGDFRQILPVIPKGVREQIVGASLRRSSIWNAIDVVTLSQNMRLRIDDPANHMFRNFLHEVGSSSEESLKLPSSINRCNSVMDLINAIYPRLDVVETITPDYFTERTILSARNEDVSGINDVTLNILPGEKKSYLAADKMLETGYNNYDLEVRYPNELLNNLNPSGFPPFNLEVKVGCPIMLLRNLSPKDGLCNGTRLMVVRCATRVIEAKILNGDKVGNLVFIPRISLTPTSSDLGIHFTRRQFPIKLAFGMTINKSQGQSVKYVGIDLRTPVFSHGQLYVAFSRCTISSRLNVLLPESESDATTNVVYNEVLL